MLLAVPAKQRVRLAPHQLAMWGKELLKVALKAMSSTSCPLNLLPKLLKFLMSVRHEAVRRAHGHAACSASQAEGEAVASSAGVEQQGNSAVSPGRHVKRKLPPEAAFQSGPGAFTASGGGRHEPGHC